MNVYVGPGCNFGIIAQVNAGDLVLVVGRNEEDSWYNIELDDGRTGWIPTASGEPYDKDAMTAAHRTLPFDAKVKVTNLANDKSVIVRINDRGPYAKHRIIDVSGAAARKLGMVDAGTAKVRIEEQ